MPRIAVISNAVIGLKDPNKQTKIKQKNLLQKYFSSLYHSLKWNIYLCEHTTSAIRRAGEKSATSPGSGKPH